MRSLAVVACSKTEKAMQRYHPFKNNYWPAAHHSPLSLTNQEIDEPYRVLTAFFDRYDLPILRWYLREWLAAVLPDDDADAAALFDLQHELQRLAEAASLLHKQHKKESLQALDNAACDHLDTHRKITDRQTEAIQAAFLPDEADATEEGETYQADQMYDKSPRIEEFAYLHPELTLREIFGGSALSDMLSELERWKRIALRSEGTQYDEADQREQLLDWLDELPALLEALDMIHQFGNCEGPAITLPAPARMLRDYKASYLSEEQVQDPLAVVRTCFRRFSLKFSHRELWSLF
jgi:hypothetical protein